MNCRRGLPAIALSLIGAACSGGTDATPVTGSTPASSTPAAIVFAVPLVGTNVCAKFPSVVVSVVNAAGAPVASFSGDVSVEITSGTGAPGAIMSGTRSVKAVAGTATFNDLSINIPGTLFRLSASGGGVAATASTPFAVAQGPAVSLAFVTSPSTALVNVPLTVVRVAEQDACGTTMFTPSHAVTLTFGNNPGGGSLGGTTMTTSAQGVATFQDLLVTKPGAAYTLVAAATGLTSATSNSFTVGGVP